MNRSEELASFFYVLDVLARQGESRELIVDELGKLALDDDERAGALAFYDDALRRAARELEASVKESGET